MLIALISDIDAVLDFMPCSHARTSLLCEIQQVLHRRLTELDAHPTTLFETLWNEIVERPTSADWYRDAPPTCSSDTDVLPARSWMHECLRRKVSHTPGFLWVRILGTSHAPPVWEESLLQSSANLIVAMSPDDRFVSADGMLHSVHVWDTQSHALLATIDLSMLIGNPSLLEFSPDSRYLAYATYDGAVAVVDWRAESVVLHDIPKGQNWSPQQVWFAQDGSSVHFLDSRGNCQQLSLNDRQWNANLRSTSSPVPRGIYRNSGTTFWSYDFRCAIETGAAVRMMVISRSIGSTWNREFARICWTAWGRPAVSI